MAPVSPWRHEIETAAAAQDGLRAVPLKGDPPCRKRYEEETSTPDKIKSNKIKYPLKKPFEPDWFFLMFSLCVCFSFLSHFHCRRRRRRHWKWKLTKTIESKRKNGRLHAGRDGRIHETIGHRLFCSEKKKERENKQKQRDIRIKQTGLDDVWKPQGS